MNSNNDNKNILLPVTGMSCAACASSVESMLKATDGVSEANVNFSSSMVKVDYDAGKVTLQDLKSTVQSIGYDLIIEDEEESKQAALQEAKDTNYRLLVRKTIISLLFTIPIVIISC